MVWDGARAGQLSPFDWESNGSSSPAAGSSSPGVVDNGFYEGRLPIHSNDASFSTQVFTMDPQTGAYTFGYDTGNDIRSSLGDVTDNIRMTLAK